MLLTAGLVRDVSIHKLHRLWVVDYVLALRAA
jgi:hypothetical protein